ncbi:MAG: tetratricopeptide repeat protein [Myxococcales bacterium]|nr:tetratricopeptide repeat protein [Myxococcales bacterium]
MGKPLFAADTGTGTTAEAAALNHDRAVELVTESAAHYEAGRFQQAVELLERAFALEASPTIQYNLARAYEGLGETRRAMDAYRAYLKLSPNAQDRGAVERRLGVLGQQLRERDALRRRAEVAETSRQPAQPEAGAGLGWIPWGFTAIGVIVVGAGVVFGLRATALHANAEEADYAADAADRNRSARTYATLANVAFVTGGVLTLGGVTWGLLSLPSEPTERAALGASASERSWIGGGVEIRGAF